MSTHQDHSAKESAHEGGKEAAEQGAPSKAALIQQKVKQYANYGLSGLALLLAVAALVMALGASKSSQEHLEQAQKKIDGLSGSLAASKAEVDKLRMAMLKDKTLQNEEIVKQGEQLSVVIRNITPIQAKLKILPTLDEQLRQSAASSTASAPVASHPASAVVEAKKAVTPAEPKVSPQVKAMKDAIEQYNKKN